MDWTCGQLSTTIKSNFLRKSSSLVSQISLRCTFWPSIGLMVLAWQPTLQRSVANSTWRLGSRLTSATQSSRALTSQIWWLLSNCPVRQSATGQFWPTMLKIRRRVLLTPCPWTKFAAAHRQFSVIWQARPHPDRDSSCLNRPELSQLMDTRLLLADFNTVREFNLACRF